MQRISLTREKLHFLHYSVLGVIYTLIDVLGHFSVIFAIMKFFVKLNLPVYSARETTRKINKILQPKGFE